MTEIETVRPERLFIGVALGDSARAALARALPKNLPGKPVTPDKWHFTLRFLGATPPNVRDEIIAQLRDSNLGPAFRIRFTSLGAFPSPRRARILWAGVGQGADRLAGLALIAEEIARSAGFTAEERPFKPHLTLSRIDPPRPVLPLLAAKKELAIESTVDAVVLYRSRLGGGPARYEKVDSFALD